MIPLETYEDFIVNTAFTKAPTGLIIFNEDLTIQFANEYILDSFNKPKPPIFGETFGNFFHCSELGDEHRKTCGMQPACSICSIRSSLLYIFSSQTSIVPFVIEHYFYENNQIIVKWFKVSGNYFMLGEKAYVILSFEDLTREKLREKRLEEELQIDLATGTINKYHLFRVLRELTEGTYDYNKVIFSIIDFDNFKRINDTLGHLAGDQVLRTFCEISKKHMSSKDMLGRFGGEEFMLILPEAEEQHAHQILKKINQDVRTEIKNTLSIDISFSVGLMEFTRELLLVSSQEDIIRETDQCLYEAKKRGKSRVVSPNGEFMFSNVVKV